MIDVFTGLLLLALLGGGFLIVRRLFRQRNMMNPSIGMPWQHEYSPNEYGRSFFHEQSYDSPGYDRPTYRPGYGNPRYGRPGYGPPGVYDPAAGYGRPMYGPGYPPQGSMGMSPWAAGGLGAIGGGLLGYELGQMAGEQQVQEGEPMNPDSAPMHASEGYDPAIGDLDPFDAGEFSDFGGDFGGGDFGGGTEM